MRTGVVRGISYGLWGPPDEFVPQARKLGAGLVRVYIYWGQVERAPGEYDWTVVDKLLDQIDDEEVWLTVCASSTWATRQPTEFNPPSPPKDPEQYAGFVRRLVERARGRVTYWQCENEPSNTDLLWAGTAQEYADHLRTMHAAVKQADPDATVVLGGCGYDVLASEKDSEPRKFFDHVLATSEHSFDLFSVHLYSDPVPAHLADVRAMMRRHGYEKPLVAGEIGGPVPFEFPENEPYLRDTMMAAFTKGEREAMLELYARTDLPDRLGMFLVGCPPDLEQERHRIACRQLVTRTLLALAGGVRRTVYWHLAPETPGEIDHHQLMGLMFGKLNLLAYEGRELTRRNPAADTFALLARHLENVTAVTPIDDHAVRLDLDVVVLWGPDTAAAPVVLPWHAETARAQDIFGTAVPVAVVDGRIHVNRTETPVFITA
jgi:hypothetical protein